MLALDIIKKANDDFKIKAIQIFAKISQVLGFQHITYITYYHNIMKSIKNLEETLS